ncbi:MAG: hypothetical protein ACOY0T_37625 [Myxococcota bacterium]
MSWLIVCALFGAACEKSSQTSASSNGDAGAAGSSNAEAEAGSGGEGGAQSNSGKTLPPGDGSNGCIISADCPANTHCDLGECVQDCRADAECEKGLVCSPRGRCIKSQASDTDPSPSTQHLGSVLVEPLAKELAEQDTTFTVTLKSTSAEPVDYRVELRAPFLSLHEAERGTFSGETTVTFKVSTANLKGTLTSGSILFHTSLGDVVVTPTIRVGLSGSYQGVMHYASKGTSYGDVGFAVDMLDKQGDVILRVDPERSMTFPQTSSGVVAGRGVFTLSEGLSVTLTQRIDANYGGSRNHFQRPIGRRIAFKLRPSESGGGKLTGSFQETVYGVTDQPIVTGGDVYLEPKDAGRIPCPAADPKVPCVDFSVPPAVLPVQAAGGFASMTNFPGWSDADVPALGSCANLGQPYADCEPGDLKCISGAGCGSNQACLDGTIERKYFGLTESLGRVRTGSNPLDDIAKNCEAELQAASPAEFAAVVAQHSSDGSCGYAPALVCALRELSTATWGQTELAAAQGSFSRLYARALAPGLFVAQNHIVEGLKESFVSGLASEISRFQKARAAIDAPLTAALSTQTLQYLESLPIAIAAGNAKSSDLTNSNYPAGRALARALYVLHTLDGEQARLESTDLTVKQDERIERAQARGLFGLIEAVTLSSVLDAWGNPTDFGNEAAGSLTLSDRGFQALQQGPVAFGVPEGEIPFVYDVHRSPSTNFEQMLTFYSASRLELAKSTEAEFQASTRAFEQNQDQLNAELGQVRLGIDGQVADICGRSFNVEKPIWDDCGADESGEIGSASLAIDLANSRLQSQRVRLDGMGRKIAIDQDSLARSQSLLQSDLDFIDSKGKRLNAAIVAEGAINAMQRGLEVAANANVWNGGAPLAMAAVTAVLEAQRTALEVERQNLQTAQEMQSASTHKEIAFIEGQANIQKQFIDFEQLCVDMQQEEIGVTQAQLNRANLLDRAKRLVEERGRVLARISSASFSDPTFRVLQSHTALAAVQARAEAQRALFLTGRALEYELNMSLGDALGRAVLNASSSSRAAALSNCLSSIHSDYVAQYRNPQEFTTTVSVRRMLGITGPRVDPITGEYLTEGDLFRRAVLKNENLDTKGNLTITFSTDLSPGNRLWSADLCSDKVTTIQGQIVGDFQGDNEAELIIKLVGGALLRDCGSDQIKTYNLDETKATIQAGVNTFGDAPSNGALFGEAVARTTWKVIIAPGSIAPANADLDINHIDDIVLRVGHKALSQQNKSVPISTACLGSIGAGS